MDRTLEVLIDADVMQHCLYDPLTQPAAHERDRFARLMAEFGCKERTDGKRGI